MCSIPTKDNQTIFTGRKKYELDGKNKLIKVINNLKANKHNFHLFKMQY